MTLATWDPFAELEDANEQLNQIFRRPFWKRGFRRRTDQGAGLLAAPDWAPAVDITETPEEYLVKAELPEVKREDVKVCIDEGTLRIEGERKQEKEEKGKELHRIERFHGSLLRTFSLPDNVNESQKRK